jgi:hypothetical protein
MSRAGHSVLTLIFVLMSSSYSCAETELNKLLETLPSKSRIGFINYKSCFLQVMSEQRRLASSFDQVEITVVNTCKKHLRAVDVDLANAGLSAKQRAEAIEEYSYLALNERRLLYEGKEVPGFEMSPWTARVVGCLDRKAYDEVETCFVERSKVLIQLSDEPAETIATAVDGACHEPQAKLIQQMAACVEPDRARQMLAVKTKLLRDLIVSAVVQARARRIDQPK